MGDLLDAGWALSMATATPAAWSMRDVVGGVADGHHLLHRDAVVLGDDLQGGGLAGAAVHDLEQSGSLRTTVTVVGDAARSSGSSAAIMSAWPRNISLVIGCRRTRPAGR